MIQKNGTKAGASAQSGRGAKERAIPPTTRARALLRRMLRRRTRPARAVMAEAEKLGIPAWALRKAKVRERVCSGRRGFGPGGKVMWGYTREEDPAAGYTSVFEAFEPAPAPQPPRCAWDRCEEEPRSPRAFYCAAHARQSRKESKRAWKHRHGALVREAMARLEARGKGRGADGGDPPAVALLEPLAAAREWLESPDPQAALRGVRANLDILERLLDRGDMERPVTAEEQRWKRA